MSTKRKKKKKRYKEEKNKKPETSKWDRTSTITLIAIALFFLSLIIAPNIDFKKYYVKNNSNWSTTCGKIISIKSIDNVEQTRAGNRIITEGYIVKYSYEVSKIIYQDSIYLLARAIKNKLLINKIKEGDSRKIYYNKINPKESHIDSDLDAICK